MRIFSISPSGVTETDTLPTQLPAQGFVWLACARGEFEAMHAQIQATLQALLRAGASQTLTDRQGNTPLQLARQRGFSEMGRMLEAAAARR